MKNIFTSIPAKALLLFLLLPAIPQQIFSQQLTDWENYTHGDVITEIHNEGDYLWLATNGGLVKFNKITEEKTVYTRANSGLPENQLRSLAKGNNGNIWVGTQNNGIGEFDGTDGIAYFSSMSQCYAIKQDANNNVWFSGGNYLCKWDGEVLLGWTTPVSGYAGWFIMDLAFDKDGILWVAGFLPDFRDGILQVDYFAKFTEEAGFQPVSLTGTDIIDNIAIDNNNHFWLAGRGGLVKYTGDDYMFYNSENSGLPYNHIWDVKIDATGTVWLISGKYLVQFDGEENFISTEIPYIDYPLDFVYCMDIDSDGTVWLGSRRSGLIKYREGIFSKINVSNSPLLTNDIAFDLDADTDGNVWLGTRHNLVKIDRDDNWYSYFEDVNYNYSEGSRVTSAKVSPSGDLWVAFGRSDTCIIVVRNNHIVKVFNGDNTNLNFKFFFDKKGNTWMASHGGLYKYDGNVLQHFTPANTPLNSLHINHLAFDKDDNLWGTAGAGRGDDGCVFKYDGINWTIYTENGEGLPSSMPTVLKFDSKGILWIHFRSNDNIVGIIPGYGLTRFDGFTWTSYTTSNSDISSNSILDIEIDKNDNVWLATMGGVVKYDGTDWEVYDASNSGIASDWVNGIALDYYRDKIWMVHMEGGGISVANLNSGNVGIESIKTKDILQGFSIYPNPATTLVNIDWQSPHSVQLLEVFTVSGQKICSKTLSGYAGSSIQYTLSDLNIRQPGMYLVRLSGNAESSVQPLLVRD